VGFTAKVANNSAFGEAKKSRSGMANILAAHSRAKDELGILSE